MKYWVRSRTVALSLWLVAGVMLVALIADAHHSPAAAQQLVERRSIIDMIFGTRPSRQYPPPPQRVVPRANPPAASSQPRRSSGGGASRPAPPPTPQIEKAEDAAKVLVIGDFMASGLAEGLETAFAEDADLRVIEETNGSSGLVRDDFYDWPGELPAILEETDPALVVVMLGSNDRQDIATESGPATLNSDPWAAEYGSRVEELAGIVRQSGAALVWVGAPAFQSPRMTADILAINDIYRAKIAEPVGTFVDIWDGFVDESGQFIFTGSDIQGQQVRLRGSDGINMTAAGKRKLAFYAEKAIRRILQPSEGDGTGALAGSTRSEDGRSPARPSLPPELAKRTPAMAITDPAFDGGTALMGATEEVASAVRSPRDRLVATGQTTDAPSGRADNFAWPPGSDEASDEDQTDKADTTEAPEEAAADPGISAGTTSSIAPGADDAITAIIRGADGGL